MCGVSDKSTCWSRLGSLGIPRSASIGWLSIALRGSPLFNDSLTLITYEQNLNLISTL